MADIPQKVRWTCQYERTTAIEELNQSRQLSYLLAVEQYFFQLLQDILHKTSTWKLETNQGKIHTKNNLSEYLDHASKNAFISAITKAVREVIQKSLVSYLKSIV